MRIWSFRKDASAGDCISNTVFVILFNRSPELESSLVRTAGGSPVQTERIVRFACKNIGRVTSLTYSVRREANAGLIGS